MKKIFFWILVGLTGFIFLREIYLHKELYFSSYDSLYWEERYLNSQWVKGWEAKEKMGDAELYAYAGWRQIKGDDPTKINPEVPPFGKYLIGFSIIIFGNPYVLSLILGFLYLWVIFILGRRILGSNTLTMISLLLFTLDPLFRENLSTSMLDLPFSLFISLAFLSLLKGKESKIFYLLSVIFLGLVAATKFYLVGFALVGVFFFYLFLVLIFKKKKDVFWFLSFLPFFALIYFANYIVYFLSGHNLLDFKYLHFWIRHFARVQVEEYPKGEILRILLLGKWRIWWDGGGIVGIASWRPWWALGFLSIFPSIFGAISKKNLEILLLCLWPVSLLVIFFVGVPYPRYLLPILPPLYILLCYNLKRLILEWGK
ncbi:MAG: hypothetical protein ACPLXP_00530 [Microgenomates group bacterium]